jgi:prepilin-type N-terminal cleavage/methylation domain-containing protein
MNQPAAIRRCRGLTLVELLAVIAIIGLLVGLLMPALQSARESSRRTTCTGNLKTIATAALSHLEHIGTFPSGGAWYLGITPANGFAEEQGGGFLYNILPFMELESLRNLGVNAMRQSPLAFGCPTTVAPGAVARNPGGTALGIPCYSGSYGGNFRYPNFWGLTSSGSCVRSDGLAALPKTEREAAYRTFANYGHRVAGVNDFSDSRTLSCGSNPPPTYWTGGAFNDGVIATFGRVRAAHVTDGLGNTLLCAERPVRSNNVLAWNSNDSPCDTANNNSGGWTAPYGWWTPSGNRPPEIFIQGFPYGGCSMGGFGSRHRDTFGAAFCDGSVRHVGFEIDAATVWRPLNSRNDGQILNLPW